MRLGGFPRQYLPASQPSPRRHRPSRRTGGISRLSLGGRGRSCTHPLIYQGSDSGVELVVSKLCACLGDLYAFFLQPHEAERPPARPPPQAPSASLGRRRRPYPPSRNLRNPATFAPLCRVLRAARVVDIGTYSVDSLTAASPEAATRRSSRPTTSQCLPQPIPPPQDGVSVFAHGECNPPCRRVDGSASLYGGGHADFIIL